MMVESTSIEMDRWTAYFFSSFSVDPNSDQRYAQTQNTDISVREDSNPEIDPDRIQNTNN